MWVKNRDGTVGWYETGQPGDVREWDEDGDEVEPVTDEWDENKLEHEFEENYEVDGVLCIECGLPYSAHIEGIA